MRLHVLPVRAWKWPWLALLAGLACSSAPKPPPPRVAGSVIWNVRAAGNANPDAAGESGPTLFKLLQLRGSTKIERLTAEDLYAPGRAKELLADDLLRMDEITVFPGEVIDREAPRDLEAEVLAVVAVVRSPEGSDWRVIVRPPPVGKQPRVQVGVRLEGYRMLAAP